MRKITWTDDDIKNGFEKFYKEYGHYPTCPEIDDCSYLPSSRQIDRRFGGVVEFRKMMGLDDINFGVGKFRSDIAYKINKRGKNAEQELELILIEKFGEPFVHIEKPINSEMRRIRYDFFVYAKNYKFGVDVFCSETKKDLIKNLNLKIDSYINTSVPLFIVLGNKNPELNQELLDEIVRMKTKDYKLRKVKSLPKNIFLLTLDNFLKEIEKIESLKLHDEL